MVTYQKTAVSRTRPRPITCPGFSAQHSLNLNMSGTEAGCSRSDPRCPLAWQIVVHMEDREFV